MNERQLIDECLAECLAVSRRDGLERNLAYALAFQGFLHYTSGDLHQALPVLEEALMIARGVGEEITINNTLIQLGAVVLAGADPVLARQLHDEALAIGRRLHFLQGIADALVGLGDVECAEGDFASAAKKYAEGLDNYVRGGAHQPVPAVLERCAGLCVAVGQFETAARLFGTADARFEITPACIPPRSSTQRQHDAAVDRLAVGDEAFARLWQQGRADSLEQAVTDALRACNQVAQIAQTFGSADPGTEN
jgi:tetratricopeptide (TPR) repeat protein